MNIYPSPIGDFHRFSKIWMGIVGTTGAAVMRTVAASSLCVGGILD